MQVEIARLQETYETDLHQLRTQLEEHVVSNQRLTTQLREKEERLREKDVKLRENDVSLREIEERHKQRGRELLALLQQKDTELKKRNAEISRLQRSADISTLRDYVAVRWYTATVFPRLNARAFIY